MKRLTRRDQIGASHRLSMIEIHLEKTKALSRASDQNKREEVFTRQSGSLKLQISLTWSAPMRAIIASVSMKVRKTVAAVVERVAWLRSS